MYTRPVKQDALARNERARHAHGQQKRQPDDDRHQVRHEPVRARARGRAREPGILEDAPAQHKNENKHGDAAKKDQKTDRASD